MSKGKQTPIEVIYQVMTSWAVTGNVNETANNLGIAESTVRNIVKANKDKPEFAKLCEEKRETFSKKAETIINKALARLEKELDDESKNIPVNHLTTAIGTLFDKKALADGGSTANVTVEVKLPPGADEYAG